MLTYSWPEADKFYINLMKGGGQAMTITSLIEDVISTITVTKNSKMNIINKTWRIDNNGW